MKKIIVILIMVILLLLPLLGYTIYKDFYNSSTDVIIDIPEKDIDEGEVEGPEIEEIEEVEEAKTSNIKLLAVGDIMFHSPQFKAAYDKESNSYDFKPSFQYIKKYVEEADLAIGNLETVTAGEEVGYSGFPRFNSPKETILALKETGFDILSTANNHSLDQGKKGIINTIDAINEYGMKNMGTYKEVGDNILIEELEGIEIGFLSYTYGLNGLDSLLTREELSYMINLIDEEVIRKDIEDLRGQVDLLVVSIHWGHEYHREPSAYQIELGEKMVNWGANIILGSHPHVIQKSQIIEANGRDNFIIYSLGNFLSNQRGETMGNPYTEDGLILILEIEKNLSSGETIIKNIEYIPTWVHKYWDSNKMNFEILPVSPSLEGNSNGILTEGQKTRMEKSFRDTMEKMAEN